MKKVNCFKCKYFHTTWNPKFPRGCRAYGFKSKELPSVFVLKSSGKPCMQFESKEQGPSSPSKTNSRIDIQL